MQEFSSTDHYVICGFGGYPVHDLLLCVSGKFMMLPSGRKIVIAPTLRNSLPIGQLQTRVQRPWLRR
jgi:hypothetical protein